MKAINKLEKFFNKHGFEVEKDKLSDDSGSWLIYKKKGSNIFVEFAFSGDGKELENIRVWKDIVEVTDQKLIENE